MEIRPSPGGGGGPFVAKQPQKSDYFAASVLSLDVLLFSPLKKHFYLEQKYPRKWSHLNNRHFIFML